MDTKETMPSVSVSHLFEKVHVHMACCGGTVVIREEKQMSVATYGLKRPEKWVVTKALLRAKIGCFLRGRR